MKAMLVVGSDKAFKLVSFYVRPIGFELIRYRQALKAMDNIDEVDPDAIIISAEDFPRHWKILVQFIRSERDKTRTAIILVKGTNFTYEDAAKSAHLGVNGIISENLDNPEELDRLQAILGRYLPDDNKRISNRIRPGNWDRLDFMFSLPTNRSIIKGRIETISANGLSFIPEKQALTTLLQKNELLQDCSLRVGDSILSPSCQVVRNDRSIALRFVSFDPQERLVLEAYLKERPLRERKTLLAEESN